MRGAWSRFFRIPAILFMVATPASRVVSLPPFSPSARLRKAMKAGLKVITVDPSKTETASRFNIHLAIKPGEDPVLLAGIISMAHAWGDLPGVQTDMSVREIGTCIGQLVSNSEGLEKFSGMPRFSSIPVNVIAEAGRCRQHGVISGIG